MTLRRLPILLPAAVLLLGLQWPVNAGGTENVRMPVGPALVPPTASAGRLELRRNYIVRAVGRVKAAVVNIHSERTVHGPASADLFSLNSSPNRVNGMGTGIVIDPRGYIVTNQHVVEDVSVIRVRLSDGTTTIARIIARSKEVDLALLKVDTKRPLPTMPLGTANDLMVGEDVIAIGNAFGYEHTVSRGIVSYVKRDVTLNKEISYKSLIQTDASINPGNSGGPLINIHGELIGVNVAIRAGAQGIGFAIPVDHMIQVVSKMLHELRLQYSDDGMIVCDKLESNPEGTRRKVIVETVEQNSPASESGLRPGDKVTKVGGVPVMCSYDVDRALLGQRPGDRVTIEVEREGKTFVANVVMTRTTPVATDSRQLIWKKLGIQTAQVGRAVVSKVNQQLNGGMQVLSVANDSIAARAGLQRGDILVGLHQWETLTVDNIVFVLTHRDLASFNPLSFYIIRNGQVRRGWLQQVE